MVDTKTSIRHYMKLHAKVQFPIALPSIMQGLNQTIMMTLSMLIIASMVGAGGVGNDARENSAPRYRAWVRKRSFRRAARDHSRPYHRVFRPLVGHGPRS